MASSPITNRQGARNKCQKLPSLPNEIGLLIPIILIIEHSRRFNLTNWPQEWAYVCMCVRQEEKKKEKWLWDKHGTFLLLDYGEVCKDADGEQGEPAWDPKWDDYLIHISIVPIENMISIKLLFQKPCCASKGTLASSDRHANYYIFILASIEADIG